MKYRNRAIHRLGDKATYTTIELKMFGSCVLYFKQDINVIRKPWSSECSDGMVRDAFKNVLAEFVR